MFATLSRGWALTKLSFGVIKQDKELLLFPVFSGIGLLMAAVGFGALEWQLDHTAATDELKLIVGLAWFFVSYFITIYFNTCMISSAKIRLAGSNPSLADGFRGANKHIVPILGWSLIAATVGLILQLLRAAARDNRNFLGQMLASIASTAWNITTYFVLPVLVSEGVGPIQAIKRSAATVRRTWGEALVGYVGIGLIFMLLGLLGLIPLFLAFMTGSVGVLAAVLAVVIVYWIVLVVLNSAASQVMVATLYRYATEGDTGGVMPPQAAQNVMNPNTDWSVFTDSSGRIRGA